MRCRKLARARTALAAIVTFALAAVPAVAQAPVGTESRGTASPLTTHVLAIGHLTAKAKAPDLPAVLAREVPATLALYLAGRIEAWYALSDQTGVVFVLNATTIDDARALLDPLPLGQSGMMTFDLMPVGPLRPLGLLLAPSK